MQIGIGGLGRMGGNLTRRLASRGQSDCADKLLAMMRKSFGGPAVAAKDPQP